MHKFIHLLSGSEVTAFLLGRFVGDRVDVIDQYISDKFFSIKTVFATVLGGLWALEWAWHIAEINLRSDVIFRICMPNRN